MTATRDSIHEPATEIPASLRISVLLPCHNEEASIAKVISDFRTALPEAEIYVFDNNSTDRTAVIAAKSGARVRKEPWQGKGNVVRRMFSDIESDVYVMADGDDTYDASVSPELIDLLLRDNLDMVSGARESDQRAAYRAGHRFGNVLLTSIVRFLFGNKFSDMLTGYRVFSRRFVKSFPALSRGFEIETELTVHALELRMPVAEITTRYGGRPENSSSKLNTWRDGFRILRTIGRLLRAERPLLFYGGIGLLLAAVAIVLAWPVFVTFAQTGTVPRFPTAILATGLMILASLSVACGLILETVTRGRQELRRMFYLNVPALRSRRRDERTNSLHA
ncbi:MAG: glycosyltransferase [Gammaproteobacteria bacterium]|nr:glycosyltransferase [Gammaproteobacteria bacterium]